MPPFSPVTAGGREPGAVARGIRGRLPAVVLWDGPRGGDLVSVLDERIGGIEQAIELGRALVRNLEPRRARQRRRPDGRGHRGAVRRAPPHRGRPRRGQDRARPRAGHVARAPSCRGSRAIPTSCPSDITGVSVFMPDTGTLGLPARTGLRPRRPRRRAQPHPAPHPGRPARDDGGAAGERGRRVVAAAPSPPRDRHPEPASRSSGPTRWSRASSTASPSATVDRLSRRRHRGPAGPPRAAASSPWRTCGRSARPPDGSQAQRATESVAGRSSPWPSTRWRSAGQPRTAPGVRLGASPRAAIWLIRSAQAHAVLSARSYRDARRREGGGRGVPGAPAPHRRGRRRTSA